MREIKFRAWDYQANLYVDSFCMDNKGDTFLFCDETGVAEVLLVDLEQSTGLQDKNGVDIYEGDVVEEMRLLHDGPCFKNVAVKYVAPSFRAGELSLCNYAGIEWKVIGNIHENPELLK